MGMMAGKIQTHVRLFTQQLFKRILLFAGTFVHKPNPNLSLHYPFHPTHQTFLCAPIFLSQSHIKVLNQIYLLQNNPFLEATLVVILFSK